MEYDVFICHASEDKGFVEPLAGALKDKGLRVWYDRFELKIGDSLRQKIDYGLANSRYGAVVLSEAFFTKSWPQAELDALASRQNAEGRKVILPIWHEIEANLVQQHSPLLASLLAARSADGLNSVVSQIVSVCSEIDDFQHKSVFQTSASIGLRERCLDVIKNGNLSEWKLLVDEVQGPVEDGLLKWKQGAESAIRQSNDEWRKAIAHAVGICLPGFVPLFAAVYLGQKEHWRATLNILHRLAALEDKMGGGRTDVLGIGWRMLYVPGNIGMAIAVETGQNDLLFDWMLLPMPGHQLGAEMRWANIRSAFWPPVGSDSNGPFGFLLDLYKSEYIRGFFPSEERMQELLFKTNLLQSIIELRLWSETADRVAIVESGASGYSSDIMAAPWWCMAKPQDFKSWAWDLFGSSDGFLSFFKTGSKGNVTPEKIWSWWKGWKKMCETCIFEITRSHVSVCTEWLTLPGEPQE